MNRPSLKGTPMGPSCCGSLEEKDPTHTHSLDGKTEVSRMGLSQNPSADVPLGKRGS